MLKKIENEEYEVDYIVLFGRYENEHPEDHYKNKASRRLVYDTVEEAAEKASYRPDAKVWEVAHAMDSGDIVFVTELKQYAVNCVCVDANGHNVTVIDDISVYAEDEKAALGCGICEIANRIAESCDFTIKEIITSEYASECEVIAVNVFDCEEVERYIDFEVEEVEE